MVDALLALALLLAMSTLAVGAERLDRAVQALRAQLFRAEVLQSEALRLQRIERQLAEAQRLSETVIAGGTQTVSAIHQGIAAIPFGILEAIPATRDTTRLVRATHDAITGAVYAGIGAVNRGIGAGLRAGLRSGAPDQDAAATPETPPEPPSRRSGPPGR